MRYKRYKFGCDQSIIKVTLLEEQSTFRLCLDFYKGVERESSYLALTAHALQSLNFVEIRL
jgi:hypothetical protein